jgi:hypothetical protein
MFLQDFYKEAAPFFEPDFDRRWFAKALFSLDDGGGERVEFLMEFS